ncbi:MAG: F0F1 ATP synthase subunit B [Chloroflexi bacterium]|nr:F0F1 ATP synthase subunit B [Chloroflexota bacterium]
MEAIAGTLGLNINGFLWHTANFLVLLFLMWRILYKPVVGMLNERTRRIQESLSHAENVRRQTEEAEAQRQALIAETRREGELMRQRADEQAKHIVAEAQARATHEAERILAQAQANIEATRVQMVADVRREVADMVVTAVDRVTRGAIDAGSQRTLIQQFLADSTAERKN